MCRLSVFTLLAIMVTALAACGGAPAPQSSGATTAPAASSGAPAAETAPAADAPTTGTVPTAPTVPTAGTAATATSIPLADTNPAKPDDATQARLRVSNCIAFGSRADVFVNGQLAVNGGMPQANLGEREVSGYLYLAPGTYSIAVVPTGMGIDKALLGPLDVPVVAGHRYTVVVLGQADEASHTPLVLDETAAYQQAGLSSSSAGHISINNVKGARGVSFLFDGMGEKDVPYGAFAASAIPAGPFNDFKVIFSGSADQVVENNGAGVNLPGIDWLDCFGGVYPGEHGGSSSLATSSLNTIDFLQAQSDASAKNGGQAPAYNTLLVALKTTGLTDQLTTGGPYLVFAPTDDAFAALPKDKRDALLADPKALTDVLLSHIVEGYYPYGSLSPAPGIGGFNRTVTNMRGEQLKLSGDGGRLTINGDPVAPAAVSFPINLTPGDPIMVANGVRVMAVSKLLLPAAQ
jgi:uncharacterized surface protein with fasciclin (FAS1) repeats